MKCDARWCPVVAMVETRCADQGGTRFHLARTMAKARFPFNKCTAMRASHCHEAQNLLDLFVYDRNMSTWPIYIDQVEVARIAVRLIRNDVVRCTL